MKSKKVLVMCGLTALMYFLVWFFSASTLSKIEIKGVFSNQGHVSIFSGKLTHTINKKKPVNQGITPSDKEQTIVIPYFNVVAHKLHIGFSDALSVTDISEVRFFSFFQSAPQILKSQDIKTISQDNRLLIQSVKIKKHPFVHYVMPLMLAIMLFLFFSSIQWRAIPAFADLTMIDEHKQSGHLFALDGLRGLAALTVLLEHTVGEFIGLGRAGVFLFFALSGFLLVRPFVLYPESTLTMKGISQYLVKRLRRILPMFYFMITIVYLLNGKTADAMRQYLLIQADGHYWTVLHELYFYLLLPFLALLCFSVFKTRYLMMSIFLFVCALAWSELGHKSMVSLYGLGSQHKPFFHVFLIGMIAGYLYYGKFLESQKLRDFINKHNNSVSIVTLASMLVFFFFASTLNVVEEGFDVYRSPIISSLLAASFVLLSAVTSQQGIYNRILCSSLLRLVGIVGFSFYLIHPYMLAIFINAFEFFFAIAPYHVFPSFVTTLGTFVLTLPLSILTYSYIEKPFLKKRV